MKPTTKIRFREPQIALVMRAHPNCNLDRLTELSFEFDQAGKIVELHRHNQGRRELIKIIPAGAGVPVREGTSPIGGSTKRRNDIAISNQ
jgi:hypothetical protein